MIGLLLAVLLAQSQVCQNGTCAPASILIVRTAVADAAYTQVPTDGEIAYTSITAPRTVTLLDATLYKSGKRILVKDESGSVTATNKITLAASGSNTIDGASSIAITTAYGFAELISDGTNWHTIDGTVAAPGTFTSALVTTSDAAYSVSTADAHQIFTQTTPPVVSNTGGSGASCTGCTDNNGKIVVTTAANTNVITLTLNTSATPRGCVIAPADANTAVDLKAAGGGVLAMAAGSFTISAPAANWAINQKNIYYSCFY